MAENSFIWTTGGTKGDQAVSYTQANWSTISSIMAACSGFEGVAPGYLNGLAGTVTGANTVAINTGGAMVDGKVYVNGSSQNVTIPSSAGGTTRIDRIMLFADWANFNVSLYRLAGSDAASPTAPTYSNTSGTTYYIELYQALVDSAGTVTLTDERMWASRSAVYRQGGSATIWTTAGSTNYVPAGALIQTGAFTGASGGSVTVTFPIPFAYAPLVFLLPASASAGATCQLDAAAIGASTMGVDTYNSAGARAAFDFFWLAIGVPA